MKKSDTIVSNYTEITVNGLVPMLSLAYKTKANLFIIGDPGLGKTEQIGRFAADLGKEAKFVTLVASMLDRLDIAGLPFRTDKNTTEFALMSVIADATQELNPNGPATVFYLNEVNAAPDSVQPALLRFLNERAVSGYRLRDNVMIVADGNHATTSRIAREMPEPSKRRFLWVHVRVDKDAWLHYSSENGCDARVTAFIQAHARDGVLCDFSEGERGRVTYACPASWSRLGADLPAILKDLPEPKLRQAWFDGQVGAGLGKQFAAFLEHQDKLPDVDAFLEDVNTLRDKVTLPSEIDSRFMLLGIICNRAKEAPSKGFITTCLILIQALLAQKMGEESIFFLRSINNKGTKPLMLASPEFKKFEALLRNNKPLMDAIMESSMHAGK